MFPEEFYSRLLTALKAKTYEPLGQFGHRFWADPAGTPVEDFDADILVAALVGYFSKQFYDRFPNQDRPRLRGEFRFIRDEEAYKIGPHTDAPNKVVSLLFYLPENDEDSDLGTGVYIPNDRVKMCYGGPHYKFEEFTEVFRAPMVRNSCFGFWKTGHSWHGVQQISRKIQRDVLLFNIYAEK